MKNLLFLYGILILYPLAAQNTYIQRLSHLTQAETIMREHDADPQNPKPLHISDLLTIKKDLENTLRPEKPDLLHYKAQLYLGFLHCDSKHPLFQDFQKAQDFFIDICEAQAVPPELIAYARQGIETCQKALFSTSIDKLHADMLNGSSGASSSEDSLPSPKSSLSPRTSLSFSSLLTGILGKKRSFLNPKG